MIKYSLQGCARLNTTEWGALGSPRWSHPALPTVHTTLAIQYMVWVKVNLQNKTLAQNKSNFLKTWEPNFKVELIADSRWYCKL